jgi:hypothetical protein
MVRYRIKQHLAVCRSAFVCGDYACHGRFCHCAVSGTQGLSQASASLSRLDRRFFADDRLFGRGDYQVWSYLAFVWIDRSKHTLLSAIVFGLVHFGGIPHGLIDMLMAGFLGWFLAKSVMETQGLFWAWLIHFIQDAVIGIGFMVANLSAKRPINEAGNAVWFSMNGRSWVMIFLHADVLHSDIRISACQCDPGIWVCLSPLFNKNPCK